MVKKGFYYVADTVALSLAVMTTLGLEWALQIIISIGALIIVSLIVPSLYLIIQLIIGFLTAVMLFSFLVNYEFSYFSHLTRSSRDVNTNWVKIWKCIDKSCFVFGTLIVLLSIFGAITFVVTGAALKWVSWNQLVLYVIINALMFLGPAPNASDLSE